MDRISQNRPTCSPIQTETAKPSIRGCGTGVGLLHGQMEAVQNLMQQLIANTKHSKGCSPKPQPPTDVTTMMVGEEDGGTGCKPEKPKPRPPTDVTTMMVGEEDGGTGCQPKPPKPPVVCDPPVPKPPVVCDPPLPKPLPPGTFTTMALGEE